MPFSVPSATIVPDERSPQHIQLIKDRVIFSPSQHQTLGFPDKELIAAD